MEPLGSLETPELTRPFNFLHLVLSHTEEMWGTGALRVHPPLVFSTFRVLSTILFQTCRKTEGNSVATTPI